MDIRYEFGDCEFESVVWPTKTRLRSTIEDNFKDDDGAPMFKLLFFTQDSTRIIVQQQGSLPPSHETRVSPTMYRRTLKVPQDLILGDIDVLTNNVSAFLTSLGIPIEYQRAIIIKIHDTVTSIVRNTSEYSSTRSPVLLISVLIIKVTYIVRSMGLESHGATAVVFSENQQGNYSCRATTSSVDALERMIIKEKESIDNDCVICMEKFVAGVKVIKMPCSHIYHESCIREWLEKKSPLCPLCRFAMPCAHSSQKGLV